MIFFVWSERFYYFSPKRLRIFLSQEVAQFFCSDILRDFLGLKKLRDFFGPDRLCFFCPKKLRVFLSREVA